MDWEHIFEIFNFLIDKHNAKAEDINADVEKLYSVLHGFDPFDKAYSKWQDLNFLERLK